MFKLAQSVQCVWAEEFRHLSELSEFIDTHCYSVCRELKAGIQMFSWTESIYSSVVHERVELTPDTSLCYIDARVVICAHDTLSPHPGGVPVSPLEKTLLRRPDGGQQDEVIGH